MYRITALKYCEQTVPGPQLFWQTGWDEWRDIAFYVFLVEGEGFRALVDCGIRDVEVFNPGLRAERGERGICRMDPARDAIAPLLGRQGLDLGDIDYVFLTHFHYDHCSNVPVFPRARYVTLDAGWRRLLHYKTRYPGMIAHPGYPHDVFHFLETDGRERLLLAADDQEVVPGIHVFRAGGHTVENMAVAIRTAAGMAVIPGDTIWMYENVEQKIPVGMVQDVPECYETIWRVRERADVVLPCHDPRVLERHPGGVIG